MVDYKMISFLKVYDTMNYHQAAEQLGLSQPAVSQHIRALEQEFGCKLFFYDGKRLHRTQKAERMAEYARAAVFNEDQLRKELGKPEPHPVRMGATKTIGEFEIADALCRYLHKPEHSLTVTVENTETLLWMLEHGELDFALIEGAFDKERYAFRLFQRAEFVGLCHKSHPFAGKTVTLENLFSQTVILREKGSGTRAIFENMLEDFGYGISSFPRVVCANNFSLICRMLAEKIGITFAYSSVARELPSVVPFHLEGLPEHHAFHFVYLKGADVEPVMEGIFPDFP